MLPKITIHAFTDLFGEIEVSRLRAGEILVHRKEEKLLVMTREEAFGLLSALELATKLPMLEEEE